ncbi:hypothetical protein HYY75_11130 [bacterium]|nr:hypothetical protein [bacterium]
MRHIVLGRFFVLFLFVFSVSIALFSQDKENDSNSNNQNPILLRIPSLTKTHGVAKFTIQVKTNVSLFGKLQEPIFTQISGEQVIERISREGPLIWERITTTCATMSSYTPGKPNEDTDSKLLTETLLKIGINPVSMPINRALTPRGEVEILEGVPASQAAFFKEASKLGFPENPVRPGEKWELTMQLPFELDRSTPPILYQNRSTFTLDSYSLSPGSPTAKLSLSLLGQDLEPASAPIHISSTGEGKIDLRLSDMQFLSIKTTGRSQVKFGLGNHFETEERIEIVYSDFL